MDSQLLNARSMGIALLATVIIFMVGAFSATYFRQWPPPSTPLEKLAVIANDRVGWTAQAIIIDACGVNGYLSLGGEAGRDGRLIYKWLGDRVG